ncbi:hypothetical protein B0H16DRAFT_812965 [Mycena metata]|uniref:Uncharacterized protein n=1 Tax=Mycena metata TaxID=1033252 RepID=A0AAD7IWR3_9AGAR|nr:hypothetical protein B0H16DRAFT_812965 [Mycena metata]
MAQSSNLFSLARSKLNLSVESKDSFSLHRWVLLKNSIIQSLPLVASSSSSSCPAAAAGSSDLEDEADDEADSFMFPQLVNAPSPEVNASEAAWLDSLLETLGEDDDDDFNSDSDVHVSVVPVDDDEDLAPSPPISPMSSSDDLTRQSYYPYLVPYPPFPPPLISPYHFNPLASSSSYVDPLPYCDLDDLDDFPPVPDAIEDTSDDESEAPPTPGQSLSSLDPASIPLPAEHSRLRHATPQIYIDQDDEYFYPIDPLPFPDNHHSPLTYPEC